MTVYNFRSDNSYSSLLTINQMDPNTSMAFAFQPTVFQKLSPETGKSYQQLKWKYVLLNLQ